jgi:hypothetical protein
MTNQEQIKDLIARKDALKKFLDIDAKQAWSAEEEKKTGWNELPGVSKALLIVVPCIWILLAGLSVLKSKKDKQKR